MRQPCFFSGKPKLFVRNDFVLCSKNIMFAEHNYFKVWNLLTE